MKRVGAIIALSLSAMVALLFLPSFFTAALTFFGFPPTEARTSGVQTTDQRTVTYRVSGTALADISYSNETNGTTNVKDVGFNWKTTVTLHAGDTARLTAQNKFSSDDTLIVEILYGDEVVRRSESRGPYCIATVAGTMP